MKVSAPLTCYYPLTPPDASAVDDSGHVRGSALRGTRGYDALVHALSLDRDSPTPNTHDDAQTRSTVDGMKLKAGTILVAPCAPGYTAADRAVRVAGQD